MARSTDVPSRAAIIRKSVTLTQDDVRDLALLRDGESPLARSLAELAGEPVRTSEAAVLHGLLAVGLQRVREAAEESGYAALASSYRTDPDEQAERAAGRRHRVRGARARTGDE